MALQGIWPPKTVTINGEFYCVYVLSIVYFVFDRRLVGGVPGREDDSGIGPDKHDDHNHQPR